MSLLERLCHEADAPPYQPCTERAVTAHLYRIINARAPVWADSRKSSGIAGFGQSHLLRAQGKFHLTAITQEIENLIRCYEPRLQRVSVTIVPQSYRQHQIHFEIAALCGGREVCLPVCLDFNAGQLINTEAADA
ncbi:TPA: GPW/gp25 family protein [Morganella morganii subsp. morganii]|uniref:IraD/Gp25-like domain-containing protein n=1 Tax=Morganella morganii TaxID=582 RepID=A0AAU8ZRG5_MORMO|nr:GPW/gp25 family protein [Morganella morganii]HDU8692837.1 GPW/gp25 family protein [Morganella morganii subsp. morganii]AWC95664.1 hypothetical protein AM380_19505 [Morganella morganii]EKW8484885.1 GPW/gp25 family protein [Morganella morganii]HAT3624803.1 hypothetical protein [Morganella morganii]HCU0877584.1 GPW/gp25 family protein [Morganella morganii]